MEIGVLISLAAVCISFLGMIASVIFSSRKDQRASREETENTIKARSKIESDIESIKENTARIESKVDKIDDRTNDERGRVIELEGRVKNLEKEVFERGA